MAKAGSGKLKMQRQLNKQLRANDKFLRDMGKAFKPKRRKRKKGCYVATCIYGSYDCPEVWTLRRFRDERLEKTWYGRAFIALYYVISPILVRAFGENRTIKSGVKDFLDGFVTRLRMIGFSDAPYDD